MQSTTQREVQPASFAIIRDYRPARIERDLLAQVFDIAQQGSLTRATGIQEHCATNDRRESDRLKHANADPSSNTDFQQYALALEAVA